MAFNEIMHNIGFFTTADSIESLLNNLKRNKVVEVVDGKWVASAAIKKTHEKNEAAKIKLLKKKKAKKETLKKDRQRSKEKYIKMKDEHLEAIKTSVRKNYVKKINTLKQIAETERADISKTLRAVIRDLELAAKSSKSANIRSR